MLFKDALEQFQTDPNTKTILRDFLKKEQIYEKEQTEIDYDTMIIKYKDYLKKYYYTRLELANIICGFIGQWDNYSKIMDENVYEGLELKLEIIRYLQGNRGYTQEKLAEIFHVTTNTINNILNGRTGRSNDNTVRDGISILGENIKIELESNNSYKKQTITPIFMGMGLGEVYLIIKCLLSFELENYVTQLLNKEICNKIYIQLSEYGKQKIDELLEKDKIPFKFDNNLLQRKIIDENFSSSWIKKATDAKK